MPKRSLPIQALLEWAFRKECVSLELPGPERYTERPSFGMEYVLIERARLGGVKIDGGGGLKHKDTHEDAEAIAAIVSNLPESLGGRRMALCVAECARSGLTPDWMPGAHPKIEPAQWCRPRGRWQGKTEKIGVYVEVFHRPHPRNPKRVRKYEKRHDIMWTPITWAIHPKTISAARAEYEAWRAALGYCRDALIASRVMRDSTVTGALPAARPWEADDRTQATASPRPRTPEALRRDLPPRSSPGPG